MAAPNLLTMEGGQPAPSVSRHLTKGLVQGLSNLLAEIQNPPKDSVNPHYNSKYADLATVLNLVRPAVAKLGLAFTQTTFQSGDRTFLQTTLMSEDCGYITCDYPVTPTKQDPQGFGSALTYARRYSLCAVLGIAAEDDDDGSAASRPVKAEVQKTASSESARLPILEVIEKSKNLYNKFTAACNEAGLDYRDVLAHIDAECPGRAWGDLAKLLVEIKAGKRGGA